MFNTNLGAWHYDFTNNRARFDHYTGQMDNCTKGGGEGG